MKRYVFLVTAFLAGTSAYEETDVEEDWNFWDEVDDSDEHYISYKKADYGKVFTKRSKNCQSSLSCKYKEHFLRPQFCYNLPLPREKRKKIPLGGKERLFGKDIPKFVEKLIIPPVLHADGGCDSEVIISWRQITQQVLPAKYFDETTLWAYGNPEKPSSFSNPSGTLEISKDRNLKIVWINDLVKDPDRCRCYPNSESCNFLEHIVQDKYGVPIIDQTLHWANPPRDCKSGEVRTDCTGRTDAPYKGAVPMVVHVHGGHTEPQSDGYPESWYSPRANNLPAGDATEGILYETDELPCKNSYLTNRKVSSDAKGYAVFNYRNDQPSGTNWFHDHTLGITRLNVYAGGASFYLLRDRESPTGETGLPYEGCGEKIWWGNIWKIVRKKQRLPGPPPRKGADPNDPSEFKRIREIPIAIQPKGFYKDASLWYPANRDYFFGDFFGQCNDGSCPPSEANNEHIPFLPNMKSDIRPYWNPEVFFDSMVVNGRTWPYLKVAQNRYRFRLLNAADSRFLNLALKIKSEATGKFKGEIPFYVIGSDQGLASKVTRVMTGSYTEVVDPCHGSKIDVEVPKEQALLFGPGERMDVIVDFGATDAYGRPNLQDGDVIIMTNTGPDEPFGGFDENDPFEPADPETTGMVMKFIIDERLTREEKSTPPMKLRLDSFNPFRSPKKTRDLPLLEEESMVCVANSSDCNTKTVDCNNGGEAYGPIAALLGIDGAKGAPRDDNSGSMSRLWDDDITESPHLGSVEDWILWNWSADAHPIHVHLVSFEVKSRQVIGDMDCTTESECLAGLEEKREPYAWEANKKDTVIALPGEVTTIRAFFDIEGLYVWHCHLLSHEDNEMMRPMCVGGDSNKCGQKIIV